jgi:putative ABC transport system permease protein
VQALGVIAGEVVTVRLSTVTGQTNVGDFVVVATFEDPQALGIGRAYVHLARLNELIGLPRDACQTLAVELANPRSMNRDAERLRTVVAELYPVAAARSGTAGLSFGGFSLPGPPEPAWSGRRIVVTSLDDVLSDLLALVRVVDAISLGVFLALLGITMIGVANSFRMVVLERSAEIGTMRALGMQRSVVRRLFLLEALVTTGMGVIVGGALAALAAVVAGLVPVDAPGVAFFLKGGRIAMATSAVQVLRNVALVLLMALIAAARPAAQAAGVQPAEALRVTV